MTAFRRLKAPRSRPASAAQEPGRLTFGEWGEACARENDIGFWSGGAYLLGEVFALPFIFFCHTVCLG